MCESLQTEIGGKNQINKPKKAPIFGRRAGREPGFIAEVPSFLPKSNQCPWTVRHLDGVEAHCSLRCAGDGCLPPCHCTPCLNLQKTLCLGLKSCYLQQRQRMLHVSAGNYCACTGYLLSCTYMSCTTLLYVSIYTQTSTCLLQ